MSERSTFIPVPLDGYPPVVGAALWQMEDARERTVALIERIPDDAVDWRPGWSGNTIGTLLYHLAVIELDWLSLEILEEEPPLEFMRLFPFDGRDGSGHLTPVLGQTLDAHLARLHAVRARFLYSMRGFTVEEYRRVRVLDRYDITPEWVIQHLNQHEGEHRGQIGEIAVAGGFLA